MQSKPVFNRRVRTIIPALLAFLIVLPCPWMHAASTSVRKPNVVVIITDDQGFAELGVTGNPVIRTPNIDRLAAGSASLVNFHVTPVCSPTRAGLMTGRYAYRTGVTDTFLGRSLMDPDEVTLAEMLRDRNYRTGIFGKWHLGDNYPRRVMDQGFQESLLLNGGGLAQPGDPPGLVDERGAYFNATLSHNGKWVKTKGYVSDVITDGAMQFIEKNRKNPFFVYLAFNCPHSPHQVPDEYPRNYPRQVFNPTNFPAPGHPTSADNKPDVLARVYGMVENIDDNVGRLLAKLDALKLADDTIVIFLSDNGAQRHNGFNGGLRGWKGTPYEGGIHQFCFIRWPAQLKAGHKVDCITSHIDLAPTLLDLCNISKPRRVKFDGISLVRLLQDQPAHWPDRTLVAQWHRGDIPERYRNFAIRSQNWKLVQSLGRDTWDGKTEFQLYDMAHDPYEMRDVAAKHPERVTELKAAYDRWFDDVTGNRDFTNPQRIIVGAKQENPVLLTRQDWRGTNASWSAEGIGHWDLKIVTRARYDIRVRFDPVDTDRMLTLNYAGTSMRQTISAGAEEYVFKNRLLQTGDARLEAMLAVSKEQQGAIPRSVKYVEIHRLPN